MSSQASTDASPNLSGEGSQATITQIESSRLLPWIMLCCILSGGAIFTSVFTYVTLSNEVRIAEREARVATERYNDIKVELVRRGIPVSDH